MCIPNQPPRERSIAAVGQSDDVFEDIVGYVFDSIASEQAYEVAHWDLMDSIGCALLALRDDDCRRHVTPLIPGMSVRKGGTATCLIP